MASLEAIYAAALEPCAAAFQVSTLLARAERATGLGDWGGRRWAEDRFRLRLAALCQGLEGEALLHEVGRSRVHSRLYVLLCSRLLQVDRHTRMSLAPALVAPLVGTGLPRAGTTFLHGLLACDPGNRVATAAQAAIPVPAPGQAKVDEAERAALYQRILAFQGFTAPDVTAIHPYAAAAPEECVFLQEGACGTPLGAFYNAPAFSALTGAVEAVADSYVWQKGMMQGLHGDQAGGRWLLKAPSHIVQIGALFAAFPDARVFINHRDPGKVIPSMASLYIKLYSLASDRSVDPLVLGPRLVANWSAILDRLDVWRDANPQARIVDVHYADLIADPIATARRLYRAFGLDLSDSTQGAMTAHLETDHHGKGPARRYGLADFGLCEADIEAAFGSYIERHGVAREARI
jgi:predicted heme/steroid binding protein